MNARPFGSWDEVSNITGIGPVRLANLQSLFSLPTDINGCPDALGLNADPTPSQLERYLIKWELFTRHTRRYVTIRVLYDGLGTFLKNIRDRSAEFRAPDGPETGLTCKGGPSS